MEAVDAWARDLSAQTDRLWQQSEAMRRTLTVLETPAWTGIAAEVFAETLGTVLTAAKTATQQHDEAAAAARVWAHSLAETQQEADRARRDAEEAQDDLERAQAMAGALSVEHAALVAALSAVGAASSVRHDEDAVLAELIGARNRVDDAQQRLDEATARARRAKDDYDSEERAFARRLESTLDGALTRVATPELGADFVSALSTLARYDRANPGVTIRPASTAVPVPGASVQQVARWLLSGAYSIEKLIALCGAGVVMAAVALVVIGGVGTGSTSGSRFYTPEERLRRAQLNMYYRTHNLDGSVRQFIGPAPTPLGTYLNEAKTFDEIESIVKEKTRKGKSRPHREVDTPEELDALHEEITRGSEAVEETGTYEGEKRRLPDGSEIGIRGDSTSGGPTIDLRSPGGKEFKIHLPKGWGK
ncbi:hypothetical protein [Leifsonia shinshuensis]|uniref:WXG100 family type VII secretion target n=1 Tax=Leifsonia shinshuensis TaxID=150026 RepID=A0A7G6Y7C2_9MICO|nr:hypothetical protein [Leifsonia shinshuensis]QNE34387.1 hypothetical protein F1C12_04045 [Leifsonia shinshuensis]